MIKKYWVEDRHLEENKEIMTFPNIKGMIKRRVVKLSELKEAIEKFEKNCMDYPEKSFKDEGIADVDYSDWKQFKENVGID